MAKTKSSLLILSLVAVLVSHSLVIPVISTPSVYQDQKTYYHHPPHPGTTPTGSHTPSHHGSGGSYGSKPPSHGGGSSSHGKSPPAYCGTPPSGGHHSPKPRSPHTSVTPTYGSTPTTPSIDHGTPSTPTYGSPSTPTYSSPPTTPSIEPGTPSTPTYSSPPTTPSIEPGTPSTPTYSSPPTTPSIEPGTPSTPTYSSPPTTPSIEPGTPSTPTYSSPPTTPYIDPGTPTTPTYGSPPTIPSIDPGTPIIPGVSVPSPPISYAPDSPPFSCNYWGTHPALIWGLFGFWGATVGGAFGGLHSSSFPGLGSQCSLEQALSNTRTDGYGALYREGTASLLNSMITHSFPFTTEQVRENFLSALVSNNAAATQAQVFKQANEAH